MQLPASRRLQVRMVVLVLVLGVSTLVLAVGPALVFVGIGALFGTSEPGIALALGAVFWIVLLVNTRRGPAIDTTPIVSQFEEQSLTPATRSQPAVQRVVDRLAQQVSIPVPEVLITTDGPPTAYTSGLTPDRISIVVSESLVEVLTEAQLHAVLAHEVAHIANRDAVVMTLAAIPHKWAFRLGGGVDEEYPVRSEKYGLLRLFASIVLVFERTVSRTREFVADRGAVALVGSPAPLIAAIRTLDTACPEDPRTDHAAIAAFSFLDTTSNSSRTYDVRLGPDGGRLPRTLKGCFPRVFRFRDRLIRTHPDPDERIERLEALAKSSLE